ncbi:hypothetical protein GE061_000506 [Apolygus lucorum]|uniref:RNA-directed DNA polymerase n=1 Tax=Apolygus lucorum TaxID=248454 RepID=A0A8S9Y4I6_APOLU|nr:hypothetical protein GE061_000506 [Apolygus lucorum]
MQKGSKLPRAPKEEFGKRETVELKGLGQTVQYHLARVKEAATQTTTHDIPLYRSTSTPSLVLHGSLNGVDCDFIVDTGATRTIVSLAIMEKCGTNARATASMFIRSISGERLPVEGETLVTLDVGDGRSRAQEVLIAQIPEDCVLGLDFLIAQHCIIDPANGTVRIGNRKLKAVNVWDAMLTEVSEISEEFHELNTNLASREEQDAGNDNECPPHLRVLWQETMGRLKVEERRIVEELLREFSDVFAKNGADIGSIKGCTHMIDVGESSPIRQTPRRIPPHRLEEVEKLVEEMEANGVIEPSLSPWASPIVLVKKKDGSTRFCIDYRKLNSVTKRDSHPMPRIAELVGALEGSIWFSTLDLQSGYWQIPMAPCDKEKTAFCTPRGLWQFKVMPFGLCNAPSTFQRAMGGVLRNEIRSGRVKVYLDDVLVDNHSFLDHINWLKRVFTVLREAGIKLNPKKCKLFRREVGYLGVVVSKDGITTDPGTTKRVLDWPRPLNVKELQSFLSLCSYYRAFIPQFAKRAAPLYALQNKNTDFEWRPECDEAFADIKSALTTPPVLGHPVPGAPFVLDTDASDRGVGAVLSQIHGEREVVLAYYSRCLSKTERNYCVTRKELLSLVCALRHFDSYGLSSGEPFVVRSDHASLQWLKNFKEPDGQLARWLDVITPYNYQIQHRAGQQHQNADALSRRPCVANDCKYCLRQEEKARSIAIRRTQVIVEKDWGDKQRKDAEIAPVISWVESGTKPSWQDVSSYSPETKAMWAMLDTLKLVKGLLVRNWENANGTKVVEQVIVPKELRQQILLNAHNFGHFGRKRTLSEIRLRYYWSGMTKDVRMICAACQICGRRGKGRPSEKAPMQTYVTGAPFERICVDALGPLPTTENGNKYIIVAIDTFTKWPEAFPVPDIQATTVARGLVDEVFSRFGVPRELHTDQGTNFEADLFKERNVG